MWFTAATAASGLRIVHVNNPGAAPYQNNRISNTKYSLWTFVPAVRRHFDLTARRAVAVHLKGETVQSACLVPPAQIVLQNLLEQMRTHMNRYFLIIATLQLFSALTPVCAAAGARGRFNRECV